MELKQQIIQLQQKGLKQCEISKQLNCASSTVSYHCNPEVKKKIIKNKRLKRKHTEKIPHPYLDKEIDIELKTIDWKYGEIQVAARLVELEYEIFTPYVGGGEIDLIAFKDNILYKIQIKTISPNKNYITRSFKRKTKQWKSTKFKDYENIDWFLIYDGTNVYKIESTFNNKGMSLRYRVPSNNQVEGIYMAKDFIF